MAYRGHPQRGANGACALRARQLSSRIVLAAALAMTATLDAQWLNHPSRGVPRTADGKPNRPPRDAA